MQPAQPIVGRMIRGVIGCAIAMHRQHKRAPLFSRVANQLRLDRASLTSEER